MGLIVFGQYSIRHGVFGQKLKDQEKLSSPKLPSKNEF